MLMHSLRGIEGRSLVSTQSEAPNEAFSRLPLREDHSLDIIADVM